MFEQGSANLLEETLSRAKNIATCNDVTLHGMFALERNHMLRRHVFVTGAFSKDSVSLFWVSMPALEFGLECWRIPVLMCVRPLQRRSRLSACAYEKCACAATLCN